MKWWYKLAPLTQIIDTFYGIEKAKYTVVTLLTYTYSVCLIMRHKAPTAMYLCMLAHKKGNSCLLILGYIPKPRYYLHRPTYLLTVVD